MLPRTLIQDLFDWCVEILLWGAAQLGISYEEINIWIFCILWPLFTLVLMVLVIRQHFTIRRLSKLVRENR